jgi:drug/metabolite transporter (DMT)-like permease
MSVAGAALVAAESIIALTPVVIKQSPLDPVAAVWSRVLSSGTLGYLLATDRLIAPAEVTSSIALGAVNLLHVASSYESFRHLPAGQAMSILYTYPLWNLLFMGLFGNEPIQASQVGLMGAATFGSFLLSSDPGIAAPPATGKTVVPAWGLAMALLMALTESGMFVILKLLGWRDPAKSVFVVNSSAAAWLGGFTILKELFQPSTSFKILKSGTWWDAAWLTAFHSVSLFGGYWLRFFAVPRLSTVTYAILSYAGLLASYVFGVLFLGETPGWLSVLGATIIVASGLALQLGSTTEAKK